MWEHGDTEVRLDEVLAFQDIQESADAARAIQIAGLTADSRDVLPGFLFAALPGAKADGARFVPDAIRNGAAAILAGTQSDITNSPVPVIRTSRPRRSFALAAAAFYKEQPHTIAAVTGTNGKSSVAFFVAQLWHRLGLPAASIGTLGLSVPGRPAAIQAAGGLTSPDPVLLHRLLARLAREGIDYLALEASSHGLDQARLDGVKIAAAAFTNLSRDHLDYHPDMAAYFAAKARLFDEVMAPGGVAVLNADSPCYAPLCEIAAARRHRVVSYGRAGRDLMLRGVTADADGLSLTVAHEGTDFEMRLSLLGVFQAENVLAAAGLVMGLGRPFREIVAEAPALVTAPGRMERVARHRGADILVDYAHTPDALRNVLEAARAHCGNRLVVVFGAGGDRDPGKRPLMGEAAARAADRVFVTDDNPRSEDPAAIRQAILQACPGAREIAGRREAIATAMESLAPDDLLIVAGKGHEQGQIIGQAIHPFDDREIVREIARAARVDDREGEAHP